MKTSFVEIRRAAPVIHVFDGVHGARQLTQCDHDRQYDHRRYSTGYIEGEGTRERPYTYLSAAPVSAHYAIVDLWFGFQERTKQTNAQSVYIKVNDWLLQVGPEGVTAEDGHFTKLI